jgi:hypothetical protein
MAITQDRLIALIEIANRTMQWGQKIQTLCKDHNYDLLAEINQAQSTSSLDRKDFALHKAKEHLLLLRNILEDHPLPPEDLRILIREEEHFAIRGKKNAQARLYAQAKRQGYGSNQKQSPQALAQALAQGLAEERQRIGLSEAELAADRAEWAKGQPPETASPPEPAANLPANPALAPGSARCRVAPGLDLTSLNAVPDLDL